MALHDNIWWTRKARIQTEKRLINNAFHSQVILLWYSIFSVFVAVYYLKFAVENQYADIAWVVFSILVLVMSVFINGLGFSERASLVKECYEVLHPLYLRAKNTENPSDLSSIGDEYNQILTMCENHTDRDYNFALCLEYLNQTNPKSADNGLSKLPSRYHWFMFSFYKLRTLSFRVVLYALPVAVFSVIICL